MGLPLSYRFVLFFGLPLVLWGLGAFAVKRRPLVARLFAFVAGGDNRLSLSRLQAFGWTLVIFGSFAAAMAVHTPIASGTDIESERNSAAAKSAVDHYEKQLKSLDLELAKMQDLIDDKNTEVAVAQATAAGDQARTILQDAKTVDAAKAAENQAQYRQWSDQLTAYQAHYDAAVARREKLEALRNQAQAKADSTSTDWVQIPAGLLALAGIAIGSGVFSSLISAVNDEGGSAALTALQAITPERLKTEYPVADVPATVKPIVITGTGFGSSLGRVRMGSSPTPVLYWDGAGNKIVIDSAQIKRYKSIVVETAHGKLAYSVNGELQNPSLGLSQFVYDFADLFRDDKNPSVFSLMKFQMFGWTIVAIGIYTWLFLTGISSHLSALPKVDSSIVILTGLSQSGYLVGKAVSNAGKKADA